MGLTNVWVMIPFVRTVKEAKGVIDLLGDHGLVRGENDLKVVMMCEIPSNAVIADQFLEHFDGFSIGSNDMTQLTLGLDRDSALVAEGFDERDPAVLHMLELAIKACKKQGKYVGICGQGPSDHPDLARVAARAGHRVDVAQPGHGRRHLAGARQGVRGLVGKGGERAHRERRQPCHLHRHGGEGRSGGGQLVEAGEVLDHRDLAVEQQRVDRAVARAGESRRC